MFCDELTSLPRGPSPPADLDSTGFCCNACLSKLATVLVLETGDKEDEEDEEEADMALGWRELLGEVHLLLCSMLDATVTGFGTCGSKPMPLKCQESCPT